MIDTFVVDVDGTLVDSNYQHLAAWARAFADLGLTPQRWRIHACLGMGGDRLPAAVCGDEVEQRHGDALRERWKAEYDVLIDQVRPMPGAAELLAEVASRGVSVVLATSGKPPHTRHALRLLGLTEDTYPRVASDDRAGLATVGLRCGGIGAAVLREAGAVAVYDDPADVLDHLDDVVGVHA